MSHIFHKLKMFAPLNTRQFLLNKSMMQASRKIALQCKTSALPHKTRGICLNIETKRMYCKKFSAIMDENIQPFEELNDLTTDFEETSDPRRFLYPNDRDKIMEQITKSTSVQDIFNVIKDYEELKHYHVCQSVLTLWDLQKAYSSCYLFNLDRLDVKPDLEAMVTNYRNEIKSHPQFVRLLELVEEYSHSFNPLELSCMLFNLKKMGLTLDSPVFYKLLSMSHESIQNDISKWCLKSLSLYTSSFDAKDTLRLVYLTKDLLPYYMQAIEMCDSPEHLQMITDALLSIHILITKSFLEKYKSKVKELVSADELTSKHIKMLIRCLVLLNLPHWSRDNASDIDYFISFFHDHIDSLNVPELIILHRTCHVQNSSGNLREAIREKAGSYLEQSKSDDRVSTFMKLPDLIFCQVTGSNPNYKLSVEKILEDCIQHALPSMLMSLYNILKFLKYSKPQITEMFWSKVVDLILVDDVPDYILLRLLYKYMYFNNNLGNSYRCYRFEQTIINKCISMMDTCVLLIPWKLSRFSAFLVAFGCDRQNSVEHAVFDSFISKLNGMKEQLDSLDWLMLARGLHLSRLLHRLPHQDKRNIILMQLDRMINEAVINFVYSEERQSLDEICSNIKIFYYRNVKYDSEDFYRLIYKLDRSEEFLSAKRLSELMVSLHSTGLILPKLFGRVSDFIVQKEDSLLAEVAQKVLYIYYYLGYLPQNTEYFKASIDLIERDKHILNCLCLLQASLALCYFTQLPESLVKYIFSIEFMERIDKELDSCYQKFKYPLKIRKYLMLLNRAVCLELPQYDIPWFHEQYIQSRNILIPPSKSLIYDDVLNTLIKVLGSPDAVRVKHFTPYGYKVDFFAQLDKKNKPIVQTSSSAKDVHNSKIAVSLIDSKTFSKYCDSSGHFRIKLIPNGFLLSRRRHLELMGYNVIDIHPTLWNSMHMSEPNEKFKYLHKAIFNKT